MDHRSRLQAHLLRLLLPRLPPLHLHCLLLHLLRLSSQQGRLAQGQWYGWSLNRSWTPSIPQHLSLVRHLTETFFCLFALPFKTSSLFIKISRAVTRAPSCRSRPEMLTFCMAQTKCAMEMFLKKDQSCCCCAIALGLGGARIAHSLVKAINDDGNFCDGHRRLFLLIGYALLALGFSA